MKIKKLLRRIFIHLFCLRTSKKGIVLPLYLHNTEASSSSSSPPSHTLCINDAKVSRHDPTLIFLSKKTKLMVVRSVEKYLEKDI